MIRKSGQNGSAPGGPTAPWILTAFSVLTLLAAPLGCTPAVQPYPATNTTAAEPTVAQQYGIPAVPGVPSGQATEESVEKVLAKKVSFKFVEASLESVADTLGGMCGITIVVDRPGLEEAGIPMDTPISIDVVDLPLQTALDFLCADAEAGWTLHEGVVLITSPERIESDLLSTRVYDVTDLVVCRDAYGRLWDDFDNLIETATVTIAPETWDIVGGPGSIQPGSAGSARVLVVTQTYRVHRKIAGLLKAMRAVAADRKIDREPPQRSKPRA